MALSDLLLAMIRFLLEVLLLLEKPMALREQLNGRHQFHMLRNSNIYNIYQKITDHD